MENENQEVETQEVQKLNVDGRQYRIDDLTDEAKMLVNEVNEIDQILGVKSQNLRQIEADIRRTEMARGVVFEQLQNELESIPSVVVKEDVEEVSEDTTEEKEAE